MNIAYDWNNPPSEFKVIYRFCDKKMDTNLKNINKWQCLNNFIKNVGVDNTTVYILDNCSENAKQQINEHQGFTGKIIHTKLGNSQSFIKALDLALDSNDNDIVYLIEDDYLHKPDAKNIILEGLEIADFVSLYDNSDKYMKNGPNPMIDGGEECKVMLTKSTHWRTTNSTTMTFATRVKNLKKYKAFFIEACESEQPKDFEMWRKILQESTLIIPIPGKATHCHEPWTTPFYIKE